MKDDFYEGLIKKNNLIELIGLTKPEEKILTIPLKKDELVSHLFDVPEKDIVSAIYDLSNYLIADVSFLRVYTLLKGINNYLESNSEISLPNEIINWVNWDLKNDVCKFLLQIEKRKDKLFCKGDYVMVYNKSAALFFEYVLERNKNFPIESIGTIIDFQENSDSCYVKFKNEGKWSKIWRLKYHDIRKDIGYYCYNELGLFLNKIDKSKLEIEECRFREMIREKGKKQNDK